MKTVVITGGAGFIGSNVAFHYLNQREKVIVVDNFSRRGADKNVSWLQGLKRNLRIVRADIRKDKTIINREIKSCDIVFHLAGQVAVTTSVIDPREDFEINALGTFNVLEAVRRSQKKPIIVYSSTNKVYGEMKETAITEGKNRYEYRNLPYGVSESQNLDFHSPYGCSKGVADQYVRDYARIYGVRSIVFRQSCIYGPRQFGVEDQGWVAWFMIALSQGREITIYGNGKQVRDLLYIDDLIEAYDLAVKNIKVTCGQIYNIGGGRQNTLSVWWEFKDILEDLFKRKITAKFAAVRPGDQPIYISDIRKAKKDFQWKPVTGIESGIQKLYRWIIKNPALFKNVS